MRLQQRPQIKLLQVIGNNLYQLQKPDQSHGAIINGFRFHSSRRDQDDSKPGWVLLQLTTRTAYKHFYEVQLNLVIVTPKHLKFASVTMLTKDSITTSPAIDATVYIHLDHHGATNRRYSFIQRIHDFELPDRTSNLKDIKFLMRMLYKQCRCSTVSTTTRNC